MVYWFTLCVSSNRIKLFSCKRWRNTELYSEGESVSLPDNFKKSVGFEHKEAKQLKFKPILTRNTYSKQLNVSQTKANFIVSVLRQEGKIMYKQFKNKRIFTILLTMLMVFSVIAPTISIYANEGLIQSKFSGIILSNHDNINMDNIEIKVYKSEVETLEAGIDEYTHYYEYSVLTDEFGQFEFTKPSEYCYFSINLDTLPEYTGVDIDYMFIKPQEHNIEVEIDYIDDIVYQDLNVEIKSSTDETLFADFAFEQVKNHNKSNGVSVYDFISLDTVSDTVVINANGFIKEINVSNDISNFSMVDKIDLFNDLNFISEEQKIELYCDLISQDMIKDLIEIDSLTPFYESISEYYENNKSVISDDLKSKIENLFNSNSVLHRAATRDTFSYLIWTINYDTGMFSNSEINTLKTYLNQIYSFYFNTCGFDRPSPKVNDGNSYRIEIYDGTGSNSCLSNLETKNNVEMRTSYITLNYEGTMDSAFKKSIAHEIMHSIQYAYNKNVPDNQAWFREANAAWGGLANTQADINWFKDFTGRFFSTPHYAITSTTNSRHYGALVWFLTIQNEFGGATAINMIMENYRNYEPLTAIDRGLKAIDSTYSRKKSFVNTIYNDINAKSTYGYNWKEVKLQNTYSENKAIITTLSNPVSCAYYRFLPVSGKTQLELTMSEADGNYTDYSWCVQRESNTGVLFNAGKATSISDARTLVINFTTSHKYITLGQINNSVSIAHRTRFSGKYL